jgi:DNA invertase Pin-like site-specific DNA recombinase
MLVWRLDRWGRPVAGVDLVSLMEALDLTTPAGPVLAGLAHAHP